MDRLPSALPSRDIAGMLIAMHKTTCRHRLAIPAMRDATQHNKRRSERSHAAAQCSSSGRNVERLQMTPSIGAGTKPTKPNHPAGNVPLFLGRVSAAQAEMKRLAAHAACRQKTAHRLVTDVANIYLTVSAGDRVAESTRQKYRTLPTGER